ncbi:MAG: hypothetical protein GWN73_19470, partial [Actinobacteria bacterium]|nr:hypothetical protein [Actinomycetota bacterium]NIU67480.1 hypothetical protein [Actinomycetota bacterium]NIW29254.1 hypothetical protein [Actinomycetota bacterium]
MDRFVEAFNTGTLSAVAETFGESAAVYRYDRAAGEFVMAAERPGAFFDQL